MSDIRINKKIIIVTVAVLLALIVGIVILDTSNSRETGGKDADTKTEQSKEDDNSGLEVLEPDEVIPENSSDASGSWDDDTKSDTQTSNNVSKDKKQDKVKDKTEDKTDNKIEDKTEDQQQSSTPNDESILKDNVNWGNIY